MLIDIVGAICPAFRIAVAVVLNPFQSGFAVSQMKLNGVPLSDKLAATLLIAQFNKKSGRRFL